MGQSMRLAASHETDDRIDRRDTILRIGLTFLFLLIAGVLETVLLVIVLFELIAALITQEPPSRRVRELANRIVSYYYRLGRYLTYNESRVPFPFADFPEAVEAEDWRSDEREWKALGLPERRPTDADEDPDEDDEDDVFVRP